MTTQSNSLRNADYVAENPYSWPGGYPVYACTSDGAALCPTCCREERESFALTTGNDGWNVVGYAANWEDPALYCDHCSERIESAYAEDDDA